VQFFLRFSALLFQLGEQFFSISQRFGTALLSVRASCPKVVEVSATGYLQASGGRHGLPPG
jgi:hypothetical protein